MAALHLECIDLDSSCDQLIESGVNDKVCATLQELSTALRYGLNPIIFLLNNRGVGHFASCHRCMCASVAPGRQLMASSSSSPGQHKGFEQHA